MSNYYSYYFSKHHSLFQTYFHTCLTIHCYFKSNKIKTRLKWKNNLKKRIYIWITKNITPEKIININVIIFGQLWIKFSGRTTKDSIRLTDRQVWRNSYMFTLKSITRTHRQVEKNHCDSKTQRGRKLLFFNITIF